MTDDTKGQGPKVPTERPNPEVAARDPGPGAEDRPGFDLGGATEDADRSGVGSTTIPGGPKTDPASGSTATGRASGLTNLSGSRPGGGGDRNGGGSDAGGGGRGGGL